MDRQEENVVPYIIRLPNETEWDYIWVNFIELNDNIIILFSTVIFICPNSEVTSDLILKEFKKR